MADEDLSEQQLQQLLKDAEERLRSRSETKLQAHSVLQERYATPVYLCSRASISNNFSRIPQINPGSAIQSYINKTKQGAQVDKALLVKPEVRQLASVVRTVEDPLTVKANIAKVCCILFHLYFLL